MTCCTCEALASPDLQLQYCAVCQSALYCSRACQKEDWKKQHKQICKLLNVGHGDMQVRTSNHKKRSIDVKESIKRSKRAVNEEGNRFFKLFQESTFEGSRAAARKMKEIAKRQTKHNQKCMMFLSLHILAHSNSEMPSWPNSPLLVLLHFVDPNVMSGNEHEPGCNMLYLLADLADSSDYPTHVNQLILAKQLTKHGANVNAVTIPLGEMPLHHACCASVVTNLDFVELLLKKGADPNAQDHLGRTTLVYTVPDAPGAAKYLLNRPTTDANITSRSGASFLARVRSLIRSFSRQIVLPDNPDRVQNQFQLQQWREIEDLLVERGAVDTVITAFD
jgi:hypothetical protein